MKIMKKVVTPLVLLNLFLTGCAPLSRAPVPLDIADQAEVIGMPDIRAYSGEVSAVFQNDVIESVKQDRQNSSNYIYDKYGQPAYSALALSGGGAHGAFGAGFVYGWGETGTRPKFKLISGISTGALIAPFAFLGETYDDELKKVFTNIDTDQIAEFLGIFSLFTSESLATTKPLRDLLDQIVDTKMINEVAKVHDQGRRLYIGTTNMDTQRLVIWNMGLIAKSKHPNRDQLFRDVMLASASIPIAFPPVYIKVESNGVTYDEMHTDGGTISQVIFYGGTLDLTAALRATNPEISNWPVSNIYIIRNGKLSPEPKHIQRKLPDISERAINTMIKYAAHNDLFRIFAYAKNEKITFNYVAIPDNFEFNADEPFDPIEMKQLFELGRKMGKAQDEWINSPPGFTPYIEK